MGLIVHVDGGSRGNPGPAGAGVRITDDEGKLIHEGAYFLGHQTNNAAEYQALIRALQRAARHGETSVTLCSDSELLVRQITGQYRVKSPRLTGLFEQVQLLLLKIPCWNIRHVPREENRRADELANLAMDRRRDVIVFDVDGAAHESAERVETASAESAWIGQADTQPKAPAGEMSSLPPEVSRTGHAARVTLAKPPKEGVCPGGPCVWNSFTVEAALPVGLCIHAAHALLPTILAVLNTEPAEFAAVPTLTVRCMQPACGATFHVSPAHGSNGAAKRDGQAT